MRKIYILILLLACSIGYLQAQAWYVYDGSSIPADLDDWEISSNNPGALIIEDVLNDPYLPGNEYFRYIHADAVRENDPLNSARKYHRHINDWQTDSLTVVTRIKGVQIDSLDNEIVFQIEVGNGQCRTVLEISIDDSTLSEGKGDATDVELPTAVTEWNIFRITMHNDSVKVYMNEDATPVMKGKNEANATDQLRFGDAGGPRVAGLMDWLIIDTTDAYAPGEGAAVPDSLSTDFGPQEGDKPGANIDLAFVTINSVKDTNGFYTDSMFVVDLTDAGFNVTVVEYVEGSPNPSDEFMSTLLANDVVVLSRVVSSSRLTDQKTYWAKLQVPVVSMSSYGARSNKMGWLPSTSTKYGTDYGVQEAKVMVPEDTIFKSVTVPADSIIDFNSDFLSFVTVETDNMALLPSSAKVLLSMVNGVVAKDYGKTVNPVKDVDFAAYSDNDTLVTPLMVRWAPLDSMFAQSAGAAARPFHYRTFLAGGDDHQSTILPGDDTVKIFGMYMYSDIVNELLVNECAYLAGLEGPSISDENNLASLTVSPGTLSPEFDAASTSYTCDVDNAGTVTIAATPVDDKATVEGAGDIEFDGTDTTVAITVTSEAGTPKVYSITIKQTTVVGGQVIPGGTGTIEEYLEAGEYDEYYLINGEEYIILDPIIIDSKITLKAQDTVFLPLGDDMPMIINDMGVSNMFVLDHGANLSLIGLDLDGLSRLDFGEAERIISLRSTSETTEYGKVIENIYVNRCKMHNVTQSAIGANNKSDSTTLKNITVMNSYVYDSDLRGVYIKDFYAMAELGTYTFENITYWNIGQQFNWIQIKVEPDASGSTTDYDIISEWKYDHITGFNIGLSGDKELFGNSEKEVTYDIQFTNIILSEQEESTQPSLYFTAQDGSSNNGVHSHEIRNVVLHECNEMKTRGVGERDDATDVIETENILTDDPQFADPENGDFTIGNSDYLTAGDDGTVLGALYWAPDFVDDASDWGAGGVSITNTKVELPVSVYPMPFGSEVNFDFNLEQAGVVTISIIDVTGRTVKLETVELSSGANNVTVNTSDVAIGTYYFALTTSEGYTTGSLVKAE